MAEEMEVKASCTGAIEWKVEAHQQVMEGHVIGEVVNSETEERVSIIAPCSGTWEPNATTAASEDQVVGKIQPCSHDLLKGDLCMICLTRVTKDEQGQAVKVMFSHGQSWHMTREAAQKLDSDTITRLLKQKKLSLILDLDHTLLHATHSPEAKSIAATHKDIYSFFLTHSNGAKVEHYVKLRPGLKEFLAELSNKFDMHIYTHGTREYALEIVKIIDPDQSLFRQRIVARTDTPETVHKSLKLLFPSCDDSMIIVLDDRVDVWKDNAQNVLLVTPYHFFRGMADVNNASGPTGNSGFETSSTTLESAADLHLQQTMSVLEKIHSMFFFDGVAKTAKEQLDGEGHCVKVILGQIQKSVLSCCHIVFSGVFPAGMKNPQRHPLWKMACSFGATVTKDVNAVEVTHLVIHPDRVGTQKYHQAKKNDRIHVVKPEWLVDSVRAWDRLDESKYTVHQKLNDSKKDDESEEKTTEMVIDDGESEGETKTSKKPVPVRRVRFAESVDRPKPVERRPVSPKKPQAAVGGFSFLDKITKASEVRKESERPQETKQSTTKETEASSKKDKAANDDDIFARLMAAEEQEEKMIGTGHKRKLNQFRVKPVAVKLDEDQEEDEEELDSLETELFDF